MNRQIVVMDIDGVLADFIRGFTTIANNILGVQGITATAEQPSWDAFPNMSQDQVNATWRLVRSSRDFWRTLPVLDDAAAVSSQLRRIVHRHDVYFATSRPGLNVREQTCFWLQDELGILDPQVVITGRKGEFARVVNADYLIDDKAGNVLFAYYHLREQKDNSLRCYIRDRKYNQFDHAVVGAKVRRVTNISQFLQDVEEGK